MKQKHHKKIGKDKKSPKNYRLYVIGILFFVIIFIIAFIVVKPLKDTFFVKKDTVSVINFGDVMENRHRDPFEYIEQDIHILKSYNVVIANLEGPIVEMNRSLCQLKAYNFQFASTTPRLLKSIGINIVNIANNHSNGCFRAGLTSTKKYLTEAGIDYIGDNILNKSFVIKTIAQKKVAFIGIDQTIAPIPVSSFYPLIKKLKLENDYVIVNIHWGTEYSLTETPIQTEIAHALIDNGADVIFGGHPHVIEPIKIYKGKVIFYSLGNFVFDQTDPETIQGIGAGVEFRDDKTIFNIFPYILKSFAPQFLKDNEKNLFCEKYLKDIHHRNCSFVL